jgi:hypothetical protein
VDRYSPFVRFQFVDSDNDTHKGRVQWTVGMKISCHIYAHSEHIVICPSGKIKTVQRPIQHVAIFWRQVWVEGANANGLCQINSRMSATFGDQLTRRILNTEWAAAKVAFAI